MITEVNAPQIIIILGGVMIVLIIVLMHFLVSALKKIENMPRVEEKISVVIKDLKDVVLEVKDLVAQSIKMDQMNKQMFYRVNKVEANVENIQKDVIGLKQKIAILESKE